MAFRLFILSSMMYYSVTMVIRYYIGIVDLDLFVLLSSQFCWGSFK